MFPPLSSSPNWRNTPFWVVVVLMGMTYVTIFAQNALAAVPPIAGVWQMTALVLAGVGMVVWTIYDEQYIQMEQPLVTAVYFAIGFVLFLLIAYFSRTQGQWWLGGLLLVGVGANLPNQWLVGISVGVLAAITGGYYIHYNDLTVFYQIPLSISPAIFFVAIFTRLALRERQAKQEVEQLAAELRLANHKLAEYAARVEELAIIQERNRMAREIHDSLGHYLTVVNVQIGAARAIMDKNPEKAEDALQKAQKLTQDGLREVRQSVSALREGTEEERPLIDQIAALIAEAKATGLPIRLQLWGEPRPLPQPLTRTLYRAVQEALTNARKHSAATEVLVELDYTAPDQMRLIVQDNGRGSADPTGGYGLLGLRERVQLLGGHVEITTAVGQGFKLMVTVGNEQ